MSAGRMKLLAFALVALGVAAMLGPACGSSGTACFAFSEVEYEANGNACPSRDEAIQNFTSSACPGPVVSVDGAGSFDGELCCYPVTQDSIVADCGQGGSSDGSDPDDTEETDIDSEVFPTGCLTSCAAGLSQGTDSCEVSPGASQDALNDLEKCVATMCPADCVSVIAAGSFDMDSGCNVCTQELCASALQTCAEN